MDQDDARVIFLRRRVYLGQFYEVRNIEGDQHPALLNRGAKQLEIVQRFERGIAGGRDDVMAKLPKRDGDCRRNIGIEQDPRQFTTTWSPATAAVP